MSENGLASTRSFGHSYCSAHRFLFLFLAVTVGLPAALLVRFLSSSLDVRCLAPSYQSSSVQLQRYLLPSI